MEVNEEELFQVKKESLELEGELYLAIDEIPKTEKDLKKYWEKAIFKQKGKLNFERRWVYFDDDQMLYKQRQAISSIDGRVYLAIIKEINLYEEKPDEDMYYYFKTGLSIYTIHFKTDATLKKWSKAIAFLKEEALKKTKPTQFEPFIAVPPEKEVEELFNCDKPNWDYEGIKIEVENEKKKKAFDLANMKNEDPEMKLMNEKKERSEDD